MVSNCVDRQRPWSGGSSGILLVLALLLGLLALPATVLSEPDASAGQKWTLLAHHTAGHLQGGELQNVAVVANGLRLGADESFESRSHPPFRAFGVCSSPTLEAEVPFDAIRVEYNGHTPRETAISVEIRVRSAEGRWSPWQEVESSGQGFTLQRRGTAVQYRITLLAQQQEDSPWLREIRLEVSYTDPLMPVVELEALATRPTVRVYGTRQGLVGRVTANGHRIVERDRFAALPSKKSLNVREGRDYLLEVAYKDRKTTVPVWDVGPWNIKDNYWDSPREMWTDLPRFVPQVNAAFFDNYNGGLDQFGRPILFPAAIDLADGTFWDDLGMKGSDWVDVTFLWVDAAAPPLVPMPVVVPKKGPIPQPIFQQPAPAPPTPTAIPTPTPVPKTWYFAEGSTSKPFDTWLLLQNPDPVPANTRVTYMLPNGGQKIVDYLLKPTSRTSIFLNAVVPDTEVSTFVESDRYILAERAMYFGKEGHDTAGVISPSSTWFFAEGSTGWPFDTWILMQNPNTTPARVTLTFFKEDGSATFHDMLIPHVSRASLLVNQVVPDAAVGVRIDSDKPIVAERAVYKDRGKSGSNSMGATALSKTWYLAEGNTRQGLETWILMLNPNDVPAIATTTYMKEDGSTVVRSYLVPHRSRISVYVNPEVNDSRVAAKVESDIPIVVERSMYFGSGLGMHNTIAAPQLARRWFLPEGSTAKPFSQNVLIANPNGVPAAITAVFMKEDGGSVEKKYTMRPTSRLTLQMNDILPDTAFSTRIESDQPVVVERSMYFNDWTAGHNSLGIPRINIP